MNRDNLNERRSAYPAILASCQAIYDDATPTFIAQNPGIAHNGTEGMSAVHQWIESIDPPKAENRYHRVVSFEFWLDLLDEVTATSLGLLSNSNLLGH